MLKILFALVLFASVSLSTPAFADDALLHDSSAAIHDIETAHHDEHSAVREVESADRDISDVDHAARDLDSADRETDDLFSDAERADGLLHDDVHEDEHTDDERPNDDERKAEQLECDRLEFEYYLRHPPGTKPSGLRGLHGCALYRADARWHDEHPNVVSVLGDNIDLIP